MKKIISAILAASILSVTSMAFAADVVSDWAKESIEGAAKLGVIPTSMSAGGDYTDKVTRLQFAEAIYKLFKFTNNVSTNSIDTPFSDVNNSAISSLYIDGIVQGKGDNKFAPDDNLTRQEASTIFGRAINKYCPDKTITADSTQFDDDTQIADWSRGYVYAMKTIGILEGYEDGTFKPANNMSKEEALAIIMRTRDKLAINVVALGVATKIVEDEAAIDALIQRDLDNEELIPTSDEAQAAGATETVDTENYTVDEDGIRHYEDGTPVMEDLLKQEEELQSQMPTLEEILELLEQQELEDNN